MKTPTTQALHTAAFTGLLSLALLPPATAADFTGSLKGVTITDAQATNKPPSATFTYTVSGNTVTFDASGSSDSDGTITEYKWDFGDGSQGSGQQAQHTYNVKTTISITLSLIDNNNGVSITRKLIPLSPTIFYDSFTSENISDFMKYSGNLIVYDNKLTSSNNMWSLYKINTDLGSSDHFIEIKYEGTTITNTDGIFPACRFTDSNNHIYIRKNSGTTYALYKKISGVSTLIDSDNIGDTSGKLRLECKGDYAEWFFNDTSKGRFNVSTVPKSNYTGIIFNHSSNTSNLYLLSLEARSE